MHHLHVLTSAAIVCVLQQKRSKGRGISKSGMQLGMVPTDAIQITADLLELLSEIDEFKGAWPALGTIAPARVRHLRTGN
jgi:hypothetical protein